MVFLGLILLFIIACFLIANTQNYITGGSEEEEKFTEFTTNINKQQELFKEKVTELINKCGNRPKVTEKEYIHTQNIEEYKNPEIFNSPSETDNIKNFIFNNNVTKFVAKKNNKEYNLSELLSFLRAGNLPYGVIYTTTNNKYEYK